jgi:hypothetical protein
MGADPFDQTLPIDTSVMTLCDCCYVGWVARYPMEGRKRSIATTHDALSHHLQTMVYMCVILNQLLLGFIHQIIIPPDPMPDFLQAVELMVDAKLGRESSAIAEWHRSEIVIGQIFF